MAKRRHTATSALSALIESIAGLARTNDPLNPVERLGLGLVQTHTSPGKAKRAHDGHRAVTELGTLLWHAMNGPDTTPELATKLPPANDHPITALSICRARAGEYARREPVDRALALPGRHVWLVEIERAKRNTPDAIALWSSRDDAGDPRIRCAAIWIHGAGASPAKPLVIGASWREDEADAAACVITSSQSDAEDATRRAERGGVLRHVGVKAATNALAQLLAPAALAWHDAHHGRAPASGHIRSTAPYVRTTPGAPRATAPAWLTRQPGACAARLVAEAAREGWRIGGGNPIARWRHTWAGCAEAGALGWDTLGMENVPVAPAAWTTLADRLERAPAHHTTTSHPTLRAAGAVVRRLLAQTGRNHLARPSDETPLHALQIPSTLWRALGDAGPPPNEFGTLDLCKRTWLVEIERPGESEPELIVLSAENTEELTLAGFLSPTPRNEDCLALVSWRQKPDGRITDLGAATLQCPVHVNDPAQTEANAELLRSARTLADPERGVVARAKNAIALHLQNTPETAPLGPYRPSEGRGGEDRPPGQRTAGDDVESLFALERAPEPERQEETPAQRRPGRQRSRGPLTARQEVCTHWKQQAMGPNRSQRRTILILPYKRGPKPREDQVPITRLSEQRG